MAQTAFHGGTTALKMATSSLFGSGDEAAQAEALLNILGNLKGPVMKAAQFLATVPGALPKEYADAFVNLQSHAPPMGEGFVRRRMRGELGQDWQDYFEDFSLTPTFAASLGQVHKARTQSGQDIACKLQYPDMESVIQGDLTQLNLFLKMYGAVSGALDTRDIFEEISEKLKEELNYSLEAENQTFFHTIFAHNEVITVPKVLPELSTNRLLTMEWVSGKSLMTMLNEPVSVRERLSKQLFHAWYFPLYHHGVLHGDPHPGNYQANESEGFNLLDFGCVRYFEPSFIRSILELYRALQTHDESRLVHAYESWGFSFQNKEVVTLMTKWARLLFDPLLDDRVRPIQEEITGWEVASDIHKELTKHGSVRPPRAFVFMDRAAVGIGSMLFHLKAELNWHRMFEELIEGVELSVNH